MGSGGPEGPWKGAASCTSSFQQRRMSLSSVTSEVRRLPDLLGGVEMQLKPHFLVSTVDHHWIWEINTQKYTLLLIVSCYTDVLDVQEFLSWMKHWKWHKTVNTVNKLWPPSCCHQLPHSKEVMGLDRTPSCSSPYLYFCMFSLGFLWVLQHPRCPRTAVRSTSLDTFNSL